MRRYGGGVWRLRGQPIEPVIAKSEWRGVSGYRSLITFPRVGGDERVGSAFGEEWREPAVEMSHVSVPYRNPNLVLANARPDPSSLTTLEWAGRGELYVQAHLLDEVRQSALNNWLMLATLGVGIASSVLASEFIGVNGGARSGDSASTTAGSGPAHRRTSSMLGPGPTTRMRPKPRHPGCRP